MSDAGGEGFQDHFLNEVVKLDVFDGIFYFCEVLSGTQIVAGNAAQKLGCLLLLRFSVLILKMAEEVVPGLIVGLAAKELVNLRADVNVKFCLDEEKLVFCCGDSRSTKGSLHASYPRVNIFLVEGRKFDLFDAA